MVRFLSGLTAIAMLTTASVLASVQGAHGDALATRDLASVDELPAGLDAGDNGSGDIADYEGEWDGVDSDDADVEPLGDWEDLEGGATQWDLEQRSPGHSPVDHARALVKRKSKGARITYYNGHDMDLPYCWPQGGYQPNTNQLVAAVAINWKGKPKCRSYVQLKRGSHTVVVRIIDMCAGCKPNNIPWFDLSERAFKALGLKLSQGVASGIQYRSVGRPKKHSSSVYGPN